MINWIATMDRMPTKEEHESGIVALWAHKGEKPRDWDMEMTGWLPSTWGKMIGMPTHWAFLTDFDLPRQVTTTEKP